MKKLKQIGIFIFISIVVGGCGSTKRALLMDTSFNTATMKQIFIYPPVDSRVDKKINVNLDKQLSKVAYKDLNKKGYNVVFNEVPSVTTQIIDEDLKAANPTWIGELKPDDARLILVIELIDVQTKTTFGSTGNAEVAGYLFDKDSKKMIWHDKGIGQVGQGGLMGMAMKAGMDEDAIRMALASLMSSIPKRPK